MTGLLAVALLGALPGARITATPTSVTVGDPIAVELEIQAPSGSTVTFHAAAPAEGLIRLWHGAPTVQRSGRIWIVRQQERWAAFRTGNQKPPPRAITVGLADGSSVALTAAWPVIAVASVIPPAEKDPKPAPLASPREVRLFPWETVALTAGILGAVAAVLILIRRRRRPERTISPLERFRAELDALAAASVPEEILADRLARALRGYLAERLGWPAREWTSSEIVACARGDRRALPIDPLRHALRFSDLTRFARELPGRDAGRRAVAEARRVAEETESVLAPQEASA
jgi:hypothetical protein